MVESIFYVRVSTDKQTEKELSLPAQLEAWRARYTANQPSSYKVRHLSSARSADNPTSKFYRSGPPE